MKRFRLSPRSAITYNDRGGAWACKKEYDKAIADLNEAIRLGPRSAEFHVNRARVGSEKGESGKAREDREQAVRLDPQLGAVGVLPDVFPITDRQAESIRPFQRDKQKD
jgi:tetratricopeptide (TPR) repeat protein